MADKKNRMRNKGQVQYFLESAFRIGFLMVALIVFFLFVSAYINNQINPQPIIVEVTANRIMYSDAVMYQDPVTGRTYPGIIDLKKLNDDTISKNIDYAKKQFATAKIKILDTNGNFVQEAYVDKPQYDILKVLIDSKGQGPGSATMYTKELPITYKNDTTYNYGLMELEVIVPNS